MAPAPTELYTDSHARALPDARPIYFAAVAYSRGRPRERADRDGCLNSDRQVIAPAPHAIADCMHPVLAQIEGVCAGGGLEIASQCDLRIAGESSRFGAPINKLGFPMAPAEMRGLLALAGRAAPLAIVLVGRVFAPPRAMTTGLLTPVRP